MITIFNHEEVNQPQCDAVARAGAPSKGQLGEHDGAPALLASTDLAPVAALDSMAGTAVPEEGAEAFAIAVGGLARDASASPTQTDGAHAWKQIGAVDEPQEDSVATHEPLLRIACEHCHERGCITCRGEGHLDALSIAHQFMAGWRNIVIDPVDSDGVIQIYVVNRQGQPSKGLRFDEDELRALVRAGSEHFNRIDRAAR